MSLTPDEAADALRNIESAGRRSGQAFAYRTSAPYFMVWGAVWVVGYAVTDLIPSLSGPVWLAATAAGAIASAVIGAKGKRGSAEGGWRVLALVTIIGLFIASTMTVMWPVSPMKQTAFVPLLAGACYAAIGLWTGARWLVAGFAIMALTLGGFFLVHVHFGLYMAAVGGGGLILAGLWMRSA